MVIFVPLLYNKERLRAKIAIFRLVTSDKAFLFVMLKEKAVVLEQDKLMRTISRIAHEIAERNSDLNNLVLVGIVRRGVTFAARLKEQIREFEGVDIPTGELDITLYRDDLSEIDFDPHVKKTDLSVGVVDKDVILCDDVIFTGRTARAAMEAVLKCGRPKSIQLAVIVDRGHRELPIKPDYIGKNVPTSLSEIVSVKFFEYDGENRVVILENA